MKITILNKSINSGLCIYKLILSVFGIYILFFVSISLKAKSNIHFNKPNVYIGKWQTNKGVNKLYDTPLGAVYQFTLSDYFNFSSIHKKNTKNNVYCLQFDMPVFYKNNGKKYRFIVIDFKIRTFPAISKVTNPKLNFSFTRSLNNATSISEYYDLNGISCFETGNIWRGIGPGSSSPYAKPKKSERFWYLSCGLSYTPYYELTSCRIIFDTFTNGVVSTNINGTKNIEYHTERISISPLGNSFGICIQYDSKTRPRKPIPREFLEISYPKITLTSNQSDLQTLAPVTIVEYPYLKYPEIKKKINRIKNPDWLYAYAMRLLEGDDLIKAVEILERAAKEKHIFAMYQLGVCYYRGYGVEKNIKKAIKWLNRAAEYSLPDAIALLGLLKFRGDWTAYLLETNRKKLYRCLITLPHGKSKHSNWVMSSIFYNKNNREVFLKNNACSTKLAFWFARNQYLKKYYKPNLDPDYWKDIADKVYTIPKLNTPIYNKTRFYDIRVKGTPLVTNEPLLMEEILKVNYLPAILYKGRLQKDDNRALEFFLKGEKSGSILCSLEALHCKARMGKLSANDFTDATDIKFSDYPLYYMLRYMIKKPKAPGVNEFLTKKYDSARKIWQKSSTPWSKFLLAAEALYQYFNYGFDTAYYLIYWGKTQELDKAFTNLDEAAKAGIIPAQYLSGLFFLNGIRNKGRINLGKGQGIDLANKAAQKGHLKAKYLLIKTRFETQHYAKKEWIKELGPLRKYSSPEAWLLTTDIFASLNRGNRNLSQKIIKGYQKAAKLGCWLAWDRLAKIYYNGKLVTVDKAKAAEYWKKFISKDKQEREQDINDIYFGKITSPIIITYNKDGLPVPKGAGRPVPSKKQQIHYFRTY